MSTILSRENINKSFRFISSMFMIFIFSKVMSIRLDWIFFSIATTVISLWLCARSINAITREIDPKDMNYIKYRIDEAFTLMLLSVLIYHFTILLMVISFVRSPDYNFIVYKICYYTIFELIPLFASSILLFLRWKENLKPIVLKISNYVLYITMTSLVIWVAYVFHLIWGSRIALSFTNNYTPLIICGICVLLIIILGIIIVIKVPNEEYEQIYETKKIYISKINNIMSNNKLKDKNNELANQETISKEENKTEDNELVNQETTSKEENKNENESKKNL